MNQVYRIVTERMIALLEKGVVPWRKPWLILLPRNISGRDYHGLNVWMLAAEAMEKKEYSHWWLTYRQATELGGHIRRGEHGIPVIFWKLYSKEKTADADGEKEKAFPILRYYTIFNLSQCEIEKDKMPKRVKEEEEKREMAAVRDPIEAAEAIIRGMPQPPTIEEGEAITGCSYSQAADTVRMVARSLFPSLAHFYASFFHELVHSTSHISRLGRAGHLLRSSKGYQIEELTAEMGAAFLSMTAGIMAETEGDQSAYLSHWIEAFHDDNRLLVNAAARAEKAADFILGTKKAEETNGEQGEGNQL